ncbi:MAG: hypothetical protein QG673_1259 [Pseudomonadota bacterium]|nr:hypothetical protein [Pseudomonadota bacterium]
MGKFKKLISICSLLALLVAVGGCNAGDDSTSTNQSISAEVTSGNCTNMVQDSTCEITITYNTNGGSDLSLEAIPNPLPSSFGNYSSTFYTTFGDCQNTVGITSGEVTCQPVVITYSSNGGTDIGLQFKLGDATSNSIPVSGD